MDYLFDFTVKFVKKPDNNDKPRAVKITVTMNMVMKECPKNFIAGVSAP